VIAHAEASGITGYENSHSFNNNGMTLLYDKKMSLMVCQGRAALELVLRMWFILYLISK